LGAVNIGETIVVDAKVLKAGKMMAFTAAEIYRKSDQKLIAVGHQTKAFPAVMPEMKFPK